MPGRPKKNPEEKRTQKAVGLLPREWAVLASADPDGSAAREAARVLRNEVAKRSKERRKGDCECVGEPLS